MGTPFLYLVTVLIWGTTWIAITYQLDAAAATTSVALRFGLASLFLFGWCRLRKLPLRLTGAQHVRVACQGACLFGVNLLFMYLAEKSVHSGVVSVIFTTLVPMNLLGGYFLFKTPVSGRTLCGAALGLAGVALVFWPEFHELHSIVGLACALLGTAFASGGNLQSARNQKSGLPILQTNAWGMAYGSAAVALIGLVSGQSFHIAWGLTYGLSLFYLAFFGSVLAFGAYLTLIGRIGAGRAAYTGVLFPLVALVISTFMEHYHWTPSAIAGIGCSVAGSGLMNYRR